MVHDGYVYIKIKKGMYGLKQSAILAYKHLSFFLNGADYSRIIRTLGLWKHLTKQTIFCLCVDDFGVKYYTFHNLSHLKSSIEQQYTCKIDYSGKNFLGFTLDWHYDKGYVDLSMPCYVKNALQKLQHEIGVYPQYSPHPFVVQKWTIKGDRQYSRQPDTTPFLTPKQMLYIQIVVGTFLYLSLIHI